MAIYHLSAKIISRSSGRSSVAAAAYRAGVCLLNEHDGIIHDFTRKKGIEYSEIILPENAPVKYKNRSILWNAVEKAEKRKDSQVAREIEVALPVELNKDEQLKAVQAFIKDNFTSLGMCVDFAIHDGHNHRKGNQDETPDNPHAHIMLTTRIIGRDGFKGKERTWNSKDLLQGWRENWAERINGELEKKGIAERIDHRSLEEQGIDREPTIHMGSSAHQMEQRGIQTERGDYNRAVKESNAKYALEVAEIQKELEHLKKIMQKELEGTGSDAVLLTEDAFNIPPTSRQKAGSVEQMVERLNGLQNQYINLELQIMGCQSDTNSMSKEHRQISSTINDLKDRFTKINQAGAQIEQLKARRDTLGIFAGKEKRLIDSQVKDLGLSREQGIVNLWRKYSLRPETVLNRVNDLEAKAGELAKSIREYGQAANELRGQQKEIEIEYKKQYTELKQHPEAGKIEKLGEIQLSSSHKELKTSDFAAYMAVITAESRLHNQTLGNRTITRAPEQER